MNLFEILGDVAHFVLDGRSYSPRKVVIGTVWPITEEGENNSLTLFKQLCGFYMHEYQT